MTAEQAAQLQAAFVRAKVPLGRMADPDDGHISLFLAGVGRHHPAVSARPPARTGRQPSMMQGTPALDLPCYHLLDGQEGTVMAGPSPLCPQDGRI